MRVRGALHEPALRQLRSVPALQGRGEVGHRGARRAPEPFERPLIAGRPVDLDVPAAPVADHRLDRALVTHDPLILRPDRPEQRRVDEAQVIAVAVVLGEHLPVGETAMLHPARGQLHLAGGRQVAGSVDEAGRRAQVLGKRDAVGGEAGEDEAPVGAHARGAGETVGALVEAVIAPGIRNAQERAAQIVGPAVIGAGEGPGAPAVGRAHLGAAVHAAVHQHGHLAARPPHHDDGLGAEMTGHEIAGTGDLALVAHEHPAAMEDALHLVGEDAGVRVERGVDLIVLDQSFVVDLLRIDGRLRHGGYATEAS